MGGGGKLQILKDGDDPVAAKIKTSKNSQDFQQNPKKSHAKFHQIVLNTQRNSYFNQATQKIPTQKNPELKISNPKKSLDFPRHLEIKIWSTLSFWGQHKQ